MKIKNILISLAAMSLAIVGCGRPQGGGSGGPEIRVVNSNLILNYDRNTEVMSYSYEGAKYQFNLTQNQHFVEVTNDDRRIYFPEQAVDAANETPAADSETPTEPADEENDKHHVFVGTPEPDGEPKDLSAHNLDKETYDELKKLKDEGGEATEAQLKKVLESPSLEVEENPYDSVPASATTPKDTQDSTDNQ